MSSYYNEHDPKAAAWLRELIKAGAIAPGDVDERDIRLVRPSDVAGYTQCHFFAGIGGWSYALRLAGWPDDEPVWTGSCPCQPFSAAGQRLGTKDPRHLWPQFRRLIRKCRPAKVFGEQVASKAAMHWLAAVQDDLEGGRYAFAPFDLPAAGAGAPHVRQRLFFVADRGSEGLEIVSEQQARAQLEAAERSGPASLMVDAGCERGRRDAGTLPREESSTGGRLRRFAHELEPASAASFWSDAEWIYCRDEKWRPVEPGSFPLVDGAPARVGRVRGYGNAIVAQIAAEFIAAFMSYRSREQQ